MVVEIELYGMLEEWGTRANGTEVEAGSMTLWVEKEDLVRLVEEE